MWTFLLEFIENKKKKKATVGGDEWVEGRGGVKDFSNFIKEREREKEQITSKRKDIINHKEVFKK